MGRRIGPARSPPCRDAIVGQPLGETKLTDLAGKPLPADALQDKVVVLHFWEYRDTPLEEPYGQVGYLDFLLRRRPETVVIGVHVDPRLAEEETLLRVAGRSEEARGLHEPQLLICYDDGSLLKRGRSAHSPAASSAVCRRRQGRQSGCLPRGVVRGESDGGSCRFGGRSQAIAVKSNPASRLIGYSVLTPAVYLGTLSRHYDALDPADENPRVAWNSWGGDCTLTTVPRMVALSTSGRCGRDEFWMAAAARHSQTGKPPSWWLSFTSFD